MSPYVSVVIPTRNRRELLAQTLFTVLAQPVDLEVIVVDEASSDGTAAWLDSLSDARVSTIRHEHPVGLSAARNVGFAASTGNWVAFVDDDDLWLPDKLERQLEAVHSSGARWAFGGALHITSDPVLLHVRLAAPTDVPRLPWDNVVPGGGSNVLVERALLTAAGGFDTTVPIVADWDMWVRLLQLAQPAVVSTPVLAYRIHTNNMSRNTDEMLAGVQEIDRRYPDLRGGASINWQAAYQWIAVAALRYGDRSGALRVALSSVRARHRGSVRLLARSLAPVRPRNPITAPASTLTLRDRIQPRRILPWCPGTEEWVRRALQVSSSDFPRSESPSDFSSGGR